MAFPGRSLPQEVAITLSPVRLSRAAAQLCSTLLLLQALPSPFEAVLAVDSDELQQLLAQTPELAQLRIQQDVLVEAVPHWLYVGDSPLHLACCALKPHAAALLLQADADPNATNRRGATSLHYACDPRPATGGTWDPEAQRELIALLARHGADVDRADHGGATPLHRAVRARSPAAVAALLECGARVDARLKTRGSTPLDLTRHATGAGGTAGSSEARGAIVDLLVAHGALRYTSTSDPPGQ